MDLPLQVMLHGSSLNVGTVSFDGSDDAILRPSQPILFQQVVEWLNAQPEPAWMGFPHYALGIGATALCVRWGSYFALLADAQRPLDENCKVPIVSMISDEEMMRINIEVSANIEELLRLYQTDTYACYRLLIRAYTYLPMPHKTLKRDFDLARAMLSIARHFTEQAEKPNLDPTLRASLVAHPFRTAANFIALWAYRNGEIEDVHAGEYRGHRLAYRRITLTQERKVLRQCGSLLSGILTAHPLWSEEFPRIGQWPENVAWLVCGFPYYYPTDWSLTEVTSNVRLSRQDVQLES